MLTVPDAASITAKAAVCCAVVKLLKSNPFRQDKAQGRLDHLFAFVRFNVITTEDCCVLVNVPKKVLAKHTSFSICVVAEPQSLVDEVVVTVKSALDVTVVPSTVTAIDPVVAPVGTVTTSAVDEALEIVAAVPLNDTALLANVVLKFKPVMVTVVPIGPLVGVKLVMEGARTCSSLSLQAELINTLARIRMTPASTTLGFRFLFSDLIGGYLPLMWQRNVE